MTITIRGDLDHLMAHHRLEELKQYLHITEEYLQRAKPDFKSWANKVLKNVPPEQHNEYYDFYKDEVWRYEEQFPRILRNSLLVSALSLLEYEINVVCNKLKKKQDIRINLSDLRGDLLERTRKYCQNAGLELPPDDPKWREIKNYYMVRNCIAHNNGLIEGARDEKALRDYIAQKKIISEDTIEEEIALTTQFCEEVIHTMQHFLNKVYEVISTAKKKSRTK